MNVKVFEVVFAMLHHLSHLLDINQITTDAIYAIHVEALGFDCYNDFLDERRHAFSLFPAKIYEIGSENAFCIEKKIKTNVII